VDDDLLGLIYELLNHRDLSVEQEKLVVEELELHGCCADRIEFERRVLLRFREAALQGGQCPKNLRTKIQSLLEEI
jgi:hypothetical protein